MKRILFSILLCGMTTSLYADCVEVSVSTCVGDFSDGGDYETAERLIGNASGQALGILQDNTPRIYIASGSYTINGWTNTVTHGFIGVHLDGLSQWPAHHLDVWGRVRSTDTAYFATSQGGVAVGTETRSYKFEVLGGSVLVRGAGAGVYAQGLIEGTSVHAFGMIHSTTGFTGSTITLNTGNFYLVRTATLTGTSPLMIYSVKDFRWWDGTLMTSTGTSGTVTDIGNLKIWLGTNSFENNKFVNFNTTASEKDVTHETWFSSHSAHIYELEKSTRALWAGAATNYFSISNVTTTVNGGVNILGYLGFGNQNPTAPGIGLGSKLRVTGGIYLDAQKNAASSVTRGLTLDASGSGGHQWSLTAGCSDYADTGNALVLRNESASAGTREFMILDALGRFGLGASSPTSKIDVVNGSVTIRGAGAGLQVGGVDYLTQLSTFIAQEKSVVFSSAVLRGVAGGIIENNTGVVTSTMAKTGVGGGLLPDAAGVITSTHLAAGTVPDADLSPSTKTLTCGGPVFKADTTFKAIPDCVWAVGPRDFRVTNYTPFVVTNSSMSSTWMRVAYSSAPNISYSYLDDLQEVPTSQYNISRSSRFLLPANSYIAIHTSSNTLRPSAANPGIHFGGRYE